MSLQQRIRIFHPSTEGSIVLRTNADWDEDIPAMTVTKVEGGRRFDFDVSSERRWIKYKPCWRHEGEFLWAEGTNRLALIMGDAPYDHYPSFQSGDKGSLTDIVTMASQSLGRDLLFRAYLPPGYSENTMKRYPVIYMHDGANLFESRDAFLGREWQVDETVAQLTALNMIDRAIVVGINAGERKKDYTAAGWDAYGAALIDEVRPYVDKHLRTLEGPENTFLIGSSLGGVISFHLAWSRPDIFGGAACLSSTFGWNDDFADRIAQDELGPRENLKIYLDSGCPGDNYERTMSIAAALYERGLKPGTHVVHCAFPLATHDEMSWAARLHLPMQLFCGRLRRRMSKL